MRTNEEIVRILIEEKDRQGLSISELARRVDMAKSAISRYFNYTREFPLNRADDFARVLGISTDYLLGISKENDRKLENDFPMIKETVETMAKLEKPRQEKVLLYSKEQLKEQQKENIIDIREFTYNYYDNAVSAGTGQYLTDGVQETITLPVDYDADFVVPVCGDSMEPIYHDWDYVFVETTYDLYDGDIGVFILDGDAYIKELRIDEEGAFLHSLNPKYRDKPILPESDFRIVGKVVGRYNENDEKEN